MIFIFNSIATGERIVACRKKSGMTQEELAEAVDVSTATVSRWENGRCSIDIDNLIRLSMLFKTSIDFLVLT